MPKVEKICPGKYRYNCTCGTEIIFETDADAELKKVVKCFRCQISQEEFEHGKEKNKNRA
jgi:hypothetical protein